MDEEQTEKVDNEAFDEAVDLSESDSVESPDEDEEEEQSMMSNDEMDGQDPAQIMNRSFDEAIELSPSASDVSGMMSQAAGNSPPVMPPQDESSSSDSDDDDDDDDQEDGEMDPGEGVMEPQGGGGVPIEGGYDPKDFEGLDCDDEIKELFSYISRYTAHNIELEHTLKPFIPDFIPAVGDIDAFLKIPKPDGKVDDTGLTNLGEPCLVQSDPTIIEMELRAVTKKADLHVQSVSSILDAQHNVPLIKKWIESVEELHTTKPATEVVYKHPMPDIEALMQVWPSKFEEALEQMPLPPADLDCSLDEYARVICAMFDIPCRDTTIPSLHVLFTLFSEFNQNQHFNQEMAAASPSGSGMGGLGNNFGETNTGVQMQGMTVVGQQMPLSPLGADQAQLHAMAMEQQHYDNMAMGMQPMGMQPMGMQPMGQQEMSPLY